MKEHGSKLSAVQVSDLRMERIKGATYQQLGTKYGITVATAWNIVNGKIWKLEAPALCPHCHKAL